MLDAYASHYHLAEHLLPIWEALPERGTFWTNTKLIRRWLAERGIEAKFGVPSQPGPDVLVANQHDYRYVSHKRRVVYLEHGAGQTYSDAPAHPAYSGGKDRDRVRLFLTLNPETARREIARYGTERVRVVGSPRLDWLAGRLSAAQHGPSMTAAVGPGFHRSGPTVGFAWHWDAKLSPEARSAFSFYEHAVASLAQANHWQLIGHAHPRVWPQRKRWYEQHGIEPVDFLGLCERADVLCIDNTSAGPEWAALTGRPLVWLNAAWYRREVEHGGRFWSWPAGQVQVDHPAELEGALVEALLDLPEARRARERMVARIYPPRTRGRSVEMCVAAILADAPAVV